MASKANPAATMDGPSTLIPGGSYFYDGSPFNSDRGGVVYSPDGRILSVAEPKCVPDVGYDGPVYVPFKGHILPGNRVAEIHITSSARHMLAKVGHGFEWELPVIDAVTGEVKCVTACDSNGKTIFLGKSGELSSPYVKITPEAHNYVTELGITPADTVDELSHNMIIGVSDVVRTIVADGGLPLATDVVGHRKMGPPERSTDKYLTSTIDWLASHGHFTEECPIESFFVAYAAQFHRDILNTEAAIRAAGFMQSANVILAAVGVNGPFYQGKRYIKQAPNFSDTQWAILRDRGLTKSDFIGSRLSWRGTLMNVVSPSAGTWREMPPTKVHGYLGYCHDKLFSGKASSSDRSTANHGDRLRLTIGKNGTFENLSQPNVPCLHSQISALLVWNAIFTSVEEMVVKGEDPREIAPFLFGASIEQARRERMLTDKLGADVLRNGKPLYEAKDEVRRVAEYSKFNYLPKFYMDWHLKSYASGATTKMAIKRWCAKTGSPPGMQAFHELGIGAPAYYAIARYEYLKKKHPELSESDIIRDCNIESGQALVNEVETARKDIDLKKWQSN